MSGCQLKGAYIKIVHIIVQYKLYVAHVQFLQITLLGKQEREKK